MVSTINKEEYLQMYDVVGAAMEVYNTLGRGMEEAIYQESMELELTDRNIPFEPQKKLLTTYKHHTLKKEYYADLYCNDIVIELKAVENISSDHRAQLFNYMRITKQRRGLLFNFGEKSLHTERYIYQDDDDTFVLLNENNLSTYVTK